MSKVIGVVFLILMAACGQALAQNKAEQLERACARKEFGACVDLGWMYDNGEGVRQDKVKAVELYTKACDGGALLPEVPVA
jgi:TPR repeat protein